MAISRFSSKGQVVIPRALREGVEDGQEVIIIKEKFGWYLRRPEGVAKKLLEDLEFAERTEAAWKEYEAGKFKSMTWEDFDRWMGKLIANARKRERKKSRAGRN